MVKNSSIYLIFLFSLVFISFGCAGGPGSTNPTGGFGGTGVFNQGGNPATRPAPGFTEVEVAPATSTAEPPTQSLMAAQNARYLTLNLGGVELDEVRLVYQNFDFDDDVSPGIEGPGFSVIRLISGGNIQDQSIPLIGSAIIPDGEYRTFDIQYKVLTAGEVPPDLQNDPVVTSQLVNHAIVIEGSFLYQLTVPAISVRIPFRFVSASNSTIRIETPVPIDFSGVTLQTLFLAHKVQFWFGLNVIDLLQSLSPALLPLVGTTVTGTLNLDPDSGTSQLREIAIQIQENIDAGFRLAPSEDAFFQETDVIEDSFSFPLIL